MTVLTEIPRGFGSEESARRALTNVRKRHRIALRGAVLTGPNLFGEFRVHVRLDGTGFSAAELASELHTLSD